MEKKQFSTYEEAVAWITGLASFGIRPGLERMKWMMERLDHPERRLKFIHVAGTNGKGSTCAILSEVLRRAGYDVGTFTSPYLYKFTNRIQYNGNDILEDDLLRLTNQIKPLYDELAATEFGPQNSFEVCTVLAILYYATVTYPDYVVFETGLGGRLDSTNIVAPVVSIITNIGHDHMDVLGDTVEAIAGEKAGIIKGGVPVVSAVEQAEAIAVLERVSKEKRTSLYLLGRQFSYTPVESGWDEQVFDFSGPFRKIPGLGIALNGEHQFKNAAVAVMALEVLRQYYALIVDDEVLVDALRNVSWPGRLEFVGEHPRILLDGAHNPEGAATLAAALTAIRPADGGKVRLMTAMMANKDHTGYLREVLPQVDSLIVTQADFRNTLEAERLAEVVRKVQGEMGLTFELVVEPDWRAALAQLQRQTGSDDLAVVSGTLYMISDVRCALVGQATSEKGW